MLDHEIVQRSRRRRDRERPRLLFLGRRSPGRRDQQQAGQNREQRRRPGEPYGLGPGVISLRRAGSEAEAGAPAAADRPSAELARAIRAPQTIFTGW